MPPRNLPRPKIFSLAILLAVLLCPQALFAAKTATEEWNITADKLTRLEHPRRIIGEGDVILEKREPQPPPGPSPAQKAKEMWTDVLGAPAKEKIAAAPEKAAAEAQPAMRVTTVIKADWISYNVERKYIEAKGNISIVSGGDTLKASSGTVSLESETGTFTNAIITTEGKSTHLEGKTVTRTGYNTYHIEQGWVITCKLKDGETPPWSLSTSSANIEKGGYAKLKNARFNVGGVPIFYTPYMVVPVKDTRQTGLLFPEWSYSSNSGFGANLPLFINLSHSADITLFPEYMTQRGFKPGLEFRYAMSDTDKGVFFGQFLNDRLSDPSQTEYYRDSGYTHTNAQRYWLYGKADAVVGNNWQLRLDLDIASDRDYLDEFNGGYTGYDSTESRMRAMFGRGFDGATSFYRDNTLVASKYWQGTSLTASLEGENDLLQNRPAGAATPLWKLPSITYRGAQPLYSTGMSLNWNANYVNYWRQDGIGANRLDLHPSISMPVPLSRYLESNMEVGVRDTYYQAQEYGNATWDNNNSQNRLLGDAQFEVATTLTREFATASFGGAALEHQIRPYVRYNYLPDVNQNSLPALDAIDRIKQQSLITYGIDNFFNTTGTGTSSREYATFRLFQSYSLLSEDSDRPFYAVGSRATWTPIPRTSFEYDAYYDIYAHTFSSYSLAGTYTTQRGDMFTIDYSYYDTTTDDFKRRLSYLDEYSTLTTGTIEQINAMVRAHITDRWIAKFEVDHSIASNTTQALDIGLIYQAPCWSVAVESRRTEADTSFLVVFSLANITSSSGLSF
ncbi:MAG: LPS assembly protein LptD [Desulfobulbaceae bacterium]|jgi:LPS-assembly protein|nr:LPS assembly protein LptD [Desulfobulbaceae bacterium]